MRSPYGASSSVARTWRPWSLRIPFFIAFAALCALLSLAIEAIMRGCSTDGCHIFGTISTKTLSRTTTLVYNLLPTALGVGLGLLWAVSHHGLMRLEPYFQMSTTGGSSVQALFLQYPYTFPLWTPFVAGKRRHYSVLLSSCIYLLMSFVVTPLIAGIFDDTMLEKTIGGDAKQNLLYPLESKAHALSDFAYASYSYSWLGRQLPPFTTQSYALLPVVDPAGIRSGNETWSAVTTLLEAELLCQPAGINFSPWDMSGISGNITSPNESTGMQFCGYNSTQSPCDIDTNFMTPWTALVGMKSIPETYYIGWARGADLALDLGPDLHRAPQEMIGVSCSPSFYRQEVNARFVAGSGEVLSADRVGVRTLLKPPLIFLDVVRGGPLNFPIPQQFLDNINTPVGLGFMPPRLPNTMGQMEWRLGSCPEKIAKFMSPPFWTCSGAVHISGMEQFTAFALYNQTWDTLPELLDSDTLIARYNNAFKLLFAFWVSIDMVDIDAAEPIRVTRRVWGRGFAVNKAWARGVQGSLVVVAAMVVVLGTIVSRRSCELDGEPNSLGEGLRLLSVSKDLSSDMEGAEFHKPEDLRRIMDQRGKRYRLKQIRGEGPRVHVAKLSECLQRNTVADDNRWAPRDPVNTRTFGAQESIDAPEAIQLLLPGSESARPWIDTKLWQLKAVTGFGFIVFLGIVLVVLIGAFTSSYLYHGLPTLARTNSFIYKLLFSYTPLAVGMSIEPTLTTIGSCYCMLGPYMKLNRGDAHSSKSLAIDYDKSPLQFQLLRSLRTGNGALAALVFVTILSSVLSVALSGLFTLTKAELSVSTNVYTFPNVKIINALSKPAREMNYILSANLLGDTPVPMWTTPEYYVLPFYPADPNLSSYEGPTLGIGVDIECKLVPDDEIKRGCLHEPGKKHEECSTYDWRSAYYAFSSDDPCWAYQRSDFYSNKTSVTWRWRSSYQVNDDFLRSANCSNTFYVIWGEQPADPHPRYNSDPYQHKVDIALLKCSSRDKVVKFTATVDNNQRVNSTLDVHPLSAQDVAALYSPRENAGDDWSLSTSFIKTLDDGIIAESFDESLPLTWLNYLLVTLEPSIVQNLTNITHIPNTSLLADTFEGLYKRLSATNMQLYADSVLLMGERTMSPIPMKASIQSDRVSVNTVMFIIAMSILVLMMAVLVVLYWFQAPQVPGHLPTTLVGMYALLYASNAKEEFLMLRGDDPRKRAKVIKMLDGRYTYGAFKSKDGKNHFGVYRVDEKRLDDGGDI